MKRPGDRFAGACFTSGSAGTLSTGDRLKELYPHLKLAVGEALQCPTILENGFGGHRIEGIGDKHIPWIHNVKNTDMVIDIDDEDSQRLLRLFNTPEGRTYLKRSYAWPRSWWSSLPGLASLVSPMCSAASRWPSTTSSPAGMWWALSSPTPPRCTKAASGS